jgi:hypothetical protein
MTPRSVEYALVCVASGACSILGYVLLRKLLHKKQEASQIYEEKALVDQYMLFNFGQPEEMLLFDLKENASIKNCFLFPKRVALLCRDYCPDIFFSESSVRNLKKPFY